MVIEIRKMCADAAQVHKPINRPQQVILWNVSLQRELIEQRRLRLLLWSQLRKIPQSIKELNQRLTLRSSMSFSTQSAHCSHPTTSVGFERQKIGTQSRLSGLN
jgi:hypothetical protein